MTTQIATGSISQAQFDDQVRIPKAALLQILGSFGVTLQLHLVKSSGSVEQLGFGGEIDLVLQVGDAFAKGKTLGKLHEADQIATAVTAVAIEEVLGGMDIEGRLLIRMQRAESHELIAGADMVSGPVVPPQVLQQRQTLFELLQILAHDVALSSWLSVGQDRPHSQARMVGASKSFKSAKARSYGEAGKPWARRVLHHRTKRDGECGHEVSGTVSSATAINSISSRRPSLQIGQRCAFSLTSPLSLCEGAAGRGAASRVRHKSSLDLRTRLARKPNCRMRTSPVGSTCSRKRRRNSTASSVMSLVRARCA